MGLAVHWTFKVEASPEVAAEKMHALRAAAERQSFAELGPVVEAWADKHPQEEEAIADRAWAMSAGLRTIPMPDQPGAVGRVAPTHVIAFRAANPGTEDAVFGLASYPNMPGYHFAAGCGTQGAYRRGGAPTFLAAHRAVIAVLDSARTLGISLTVADDGEFWMSRDPKRLLDKFAEWQTLATALERRRAAASSRAILKCDILPRLQTTPPRARKDQAQYEELEG